MVKIERRRELAKEGKMACPTQLAYPLDTTKRVKNAMARYRQEGTVKCEGGMRRICKAYRGKDLTHTEAYEKHCK